MLAPLFLAASANSQSHRWRDATRRDQSDVAWLAALLRLSEGAARLSEGAARRRSAGGAGVQFNHGVHRCCTDILASCHACVCKTLTLCDAYALDDRGVEVAPEITCHRFRCELAREEADAQRVHHAVLL